MPVRGYDVTELVLIRDFFCSHPISTCIFSPTASPEAKRATRLKSNVVNVVMVAQQRGNGTVFASFFVVDDATARKCKFDCIEV